MIATAAPSPADTKPYTGNKYFPSTFSLDSVPNLQGKTAVVTGGNSGIGFETSKHLALNGAHVIITCRSQEKCDKAIEDINQAALTAGKSVQLDAVVVNLSDLSQTQIAAKSLAQSLDKIDILICNAGIFNPQDSAFEATSCGLESMFAINHLAHFVWTLQLLPLLLQSSTSNTPRIVMVSSYATWRAPLCGIDFESLAVPNPTFTGRHYYGQSKLANMLFAAELNRRVGDRVVVNSVHPGNVATPMTKNLFAKPGSNGVYTDILDAEKGAFASLYAATSEELTEHNIRAGYIVPFGVVSTDYNPLANDIPLAKKLWEFSEKYLE